MVIAQSILLMLIFLEELAALAAFSYWGFHSGRGWVLKIALGVGVPAIVAVFWGAFLAPKAAYPVPVVPRLLLKTLVFGLAAAALYAAGRGKLGISFAVAVPVTHVLSYVLGDPPSE
jgi:hypothetical protein